MKSFDQTGYFLKCIILFQILSLVSTQDTQVSNIELSNEKNFTLASNAFAFKVYKSLANKGNGNLFFSPVSLQTVLALAFTGARGDTARELSDILVLPENLEQVYSDYNALTKDLKDSVLKIANRIFVDTSTSLQETFQVNAEKYFLAKAESLNFTSDAEVSRKHINAWVEEQTKNLIKDLLQPGFIDGTTSMVLVNAVHFKADWAIKFPERSTRERTFHVSNTKDVPVQMMNVENKFPYTFNDELNAHFVDLKYAGGHFSMLLIVPKTNDGLSVVEDQLQTINIPDMMSRLRKVKVDLYLPMFRMENTFELSDVLKSLGAPTMFSPRADFSGMTGQKMTVSKVVQKAFVEVSEQGTEAAAATAMNMIFKSARLTPSPKIVVVADHPFIFIIAQKSKPIFIGRFALPKV